jgi:hypothetical protein
MVSTPKPPDPVATAQAQAGLNRDTAITQQQLNMVNQVGPDGSLTYNQTGTAKFKDSKGNWVETPTYTATTALSDAQKAIKAQTDSASLNLGTLANQQSSFLKDYLAKPFEFNNQDAENWAYDLGAKRLDPRLAKEQESLRTQLIAQGIRPGTAAYESQMGQFTQGKNDAYNQLMLTGRQQAYNEALSSRNQPINEISALMSGSQVSQPQFQSTPQTGVGGVDYTGLVNQNYQGQLAKANAGMGGLFGLASAGIGLLSDRRAKTDIRRVGALHNGLVVYSYRYKGEAETQIGLMADEVERMHPEAVTRGPDGLQRVRYDLAVESV